jgi:glutamine synthetase
MAEILEKSEQANFHDTLQELLSRTVREHKRVLFNGDGYGDAWLEEATKRGLPNLKTTPEALKALTDRKNIELFCKYGVFTERELESRYEIHLDDYRQKVTIEAACALDIASTMIVPAVRDETAKAFAAYSGLKASGVSGGVEAMRVLAEEAGRRFDGLSDAIAKLQKAYSDGDTASLLPLMEKLREAVDDCENAVDDQAWPLPKYREMMFVY